MLILLWSCGSSLQLSDVNRDTQTETVKVQLKDSTYQAMAVDYHYPKTILEKALAYRLEAEGLSKSKSASNKFRAIKGAKWHQISPNRLDYYYKISGDKHQSTLKMLVSRGYDNFVDLEGTSDLKRNLKAFMESLENNLYGQTLKTIIAAKQKAAKKANKKLKKQQKALQEAQEVVNQNKQEIQSLKDKLENIHAGS